MLTKTTLVLSSDFKNVLYKTRVLFHNLKTKPTILNDYLLKPNYYFLRNKLVYHRSSWHINLELFTSLHIRQLNIWKSINYSDSAFLDEKSYERISEETLDSLNEKLELFLDKIDNKTCDIMFNNGVITLSLGNNGIYVINKQSPNKQIWLSSPVSGPKRYDYIDGKWIYKHNGQSLQDLLKLELEKMFNLQVDL